MKDSKIDVMAKVFWTPPTQPTIEELPWFRLTIARLGDYSGKSVVVSFNSIAVRE